MTIFDFTLLLVLAVFTALGAWRGLVRELVSILTWIVATLTAWVFADDLAVFFKRLTSEQALQQMLAFSVIFIGVFIIGTLVGVVLHRVVSRSSGLRVANRMVGAVLGLMRGAVIIVVVFLLAGLTAFPQRMWWREAALTPVFERAAIYVARYLPPDIARHLRYG